jgi:hypothetical protein
LLIVIHRIGSYGISMLHLGTASLALSPHSLAAVWTQW